MPSTLEQAVTFGTDTSKDLRVPNHPTDLLHFDTHQNGEARSHQMISLHFLKISAATMGWREHGMGMA